MFKIGNLELQSRLLLGTGKFENEDVQTEAIKASETNVLTFAVRRMNLYDKNLPNPLANINLKDFITFPNTLAQKLEEAIRIAEIAKHAGVCDMIKVEVIGDDETLLPDPFETYEACKVLLERGYIVCPYISNDVVLAKRLEDLGVHAVMPLASPIGTGRGINNQLNLSYIIKTQMCQLSLMLWYWFSERCMSCDGIRGRYSTQYCIRCERSCEDGRSNEIRYSWVACLMKQDESQLNILRKHQAQLKV